MSGYNKVILIGNLTRDPQMTYMPSQTPVTELGLAINRRWKGADGEQQEEVCFVDCKAFGRQAETMNQYLTKGRSVLIEGHLRLDRWEAKDGTKRSKLHVVVDRFQFLSDPKEEREQAPPRPAAPAPIPEQDQDGLPF